MNDVIEGFIDECFIKDVIFGENSVYENFYDEIRTNNHDTSSIITPTIHV